MCGNCRRRRGRKVSNLLKYAVMLIRMISCIYVAPSCPSNLNWHPGIQLTIASKERQHSEHKRNLFRKEYREKKSKDVLVGFCFVFSFIVKHAIPGSQRWWGKNEIQTYSSFKAFRKKGDTANLGEDSACPSLRLGRIVGMPHVRTLQCPKWSG